MSALTRIVYDHTPGQAYAYSPILATVATRNTWRGIPCCDVLTSAPPSGPEPRRFTPLAGNVALLGTGEAFAVRSTSHPERAYLVFRSADEASWACSCPADHNRLSAEGRHCSTIGKVQACDV